MSDKIQLCPIVLSIFFISAAGAAIKIFCLLQSTCVSVQTDRGSFVGLACYDGWGGGHIEDRDRA